MQLTRWSLLFILLLTSRCQSHKPPFLLSIDCDDTYLNGRALAPLYPTHWTHRFSIQPDLTAVLRDHPVDSIHLKINPQVSSHQVLSYLEVLQLWPVRQLVFETANSQNLTVITPPPSAAATDHLYISSWLPGSDLHRASPHDCTTFKPNAVVAFHVSIGVHAEPVLRQLICLNGLSVRFERMFD